MADQPPGGADRRLTLTLLSRRDCSLCEEFHAAFSRWNAEHGPHVLEVVDVDTDPALAARFGERVPVLLHDGEEVCAIRFRGDSLAAHASSG